VKLVYFGAFNQLLESLPRFQVMAGLSDELMDGFRAMLYENFQRKVLDAITNELLTPRIHIPALIFHDAADNVTPVEDSRAIARVWKHAHYIETQGLGHRGALQSKPIHEQVVKF
jgi:pimeloyl-ACP methyl ester carboxylesterase